MADPLLTRQDMVERLDTTAMVLEQVATEAVDDGDLDLAADLWLASARLLAAADELWRPVQQGRLDSGRRHDDA